MDRSRLSFPPPNTYSKHRMYLTSQWKRSIAKLLVPVDWSTIRNLPLRLPKWRQHWIPSIRSLQFSESPVAMKAETTHLVGNSIEGTKGVGMLSLISSCVVVVHGWTTILGLWKRAYCPTRRAFNKTNVIQFVTASCFDALAAMALAVCLAVCCSLSCLKLWFPPSEAIQTPKRQAWNKAWKSSAIVYERGRYASLRMNWNVKLR